MTQCRKGHREDFRDTKLILIIILNVVYYYGKVFPKKLFSIITFQELKPGGELFLQALVLNEPSNQYKSNYAMFPLSCRCKCEMFLFSFV